MSRRRRTLVLIAGLGLLAAACTDDNPQTDLPCEFYFGQIESGVDVTIPEECEGERPPTSPPDTAPQVTTPPDEAPPTTVAP